MYSFLKTQSDVRISKKVVYGPFERESLNVDILIWDWLCNDSQPFDHRDPGSGL